MMFLNSEELMNAALDEIAAAVDSDAEDGEIVSHVRGVVGLVRMIREKKEKEKS